MAELKRIAPSAVPAALEKALRYRLLNEPMEAESICRDVLDVDAENQEALITLLLAVTDQFETEFTGGLDKANTVLRRIKGEYEQAYYEGIINERWAVAQMARGVPADSALQWLQKAMRFYAHAESTADPDNPDATLRWNTCARILAQHESSRTASAASKIRTEREFGDEVPPRR